MTMLKAFNKGTALSPGVSVNSSQVPNGEDDQSRQTVFEHGRTSLNLLDETQGDGEDGNSSIGPQPVFYAGVMLRGHKSDLVRLFEIPPSERLNGDFHCAMRKRVLLQGRMYVFDNYVCFYSAVFGYAKKRRMPMRTIKAVRKKKHLGFPNSLEIETDENKEFFTSFLSREEAYQLIMRLLPEAKHRAGDDPEPGLRRSTDTGSFTAPGGARELSSPQSTSRGPGGEGRRRSGGTAGGAGPGPSANGGGRPQLRVNGATSLLTRNSGSMADENDDDEEDRVWVVLESRQAPPVASGSRHVVHCTLPGTPRDFFDMVLADNAPFLEDFLDSQGNRRINITSWKRHQQLGHVRDMNFTAPIKGAFGNWGVSHTACYQSQRFCVYADEHIVFESSQTMTDIPYGDCFTVDQRWDVRRELHADPDRPQVCFDLHVRVPFTSRCLFKAVIESGSVKQVHETYSQFVEQLRPVLQERLLSRGTLSLREPVESPRPTASQTPRINSAVPGQLRASGTLQRSVQNLTALRGFDPTEQSEISLAALRQSVQGQGQHPVGAIPPEPSVGRLLLSLGSRLVEGAGGLMEAGIDVVINLTQCRTTPQMRFLVALVLVMFLANLLCMLMYLWPSGGSAGAGAGTAGEGAGAAGVASGGAPGLQLNFSSLQGLGLGLDLASAGTGQGSAGDAAAAAGVSEPQLELQWHWVQRMAALQQELALLQGRMELVSREVALVMKHLTQAAAAAAAAANGGTGPDGAAAAAAAGTVPAGMDAAGGGEL